MLYPLQFDEHPGLFNDRCVVQDREECVIAITKDIGSAAFLARAANAIRRVKDLVRMAEIMGETLTVDQLRDAIEGHKRPLGAMS